MAEMNGRVLFLAGGAERRSHPRYPGEESCTLHLTDRATSIPCSIVDLSQEGCRLRFEARPAFSSGEVAEIHIKIRNIKLQLSGTVQWAVAELAGIQFSQSIPSRLLAMREVMNELMTARMIAVRIAGESTGGNSPAEVQAKPKSEPSLESSKSALTHSSTDLSEDRQAAAKGSAAEEEAGRRKRANARHEVDEFALLFLVNVGSKLRGRILDLSLSGCRIRTDERFPVGIYTRIEAEFHLEGLPFRLGGVVQTILDRHTVGIRFLDVSPRKAEQLTELDTEIKEMRRLSAEAFAPGI